MPNIKSVKKDVLRSRERASRNQSTKSRIKTFTKKAHAAMYSGKDIASIARVVSQTVSVIDKAAKHGIIHKNAADRRKSRLMRRANAEFAAMASADPTYTTSPASSELSEETKQWQRLNREERRELRVVQSFTGEVVAIEDGIALIDLCSDAGEPVTIEYDAEALSRGIVAGDAVKADVLEDGSEENHFVITPIKRKFLTSKEKIQLYNTFKLKPVDSSVSS